MSEFYLISTCDKRQNPMVLHLSKPPDGVERGLIGVVKFDETCISHPTGTLDKWTSEANNVARCHPRSVVIEIADNIATVRRSDTARERASKLFAKTNGVKKRQVSARSK